MNGWTDEWMVRQNDGWILFLQELNVKIQDDMNVTGQNNSVVEWYVIVKFACDGFLDGRRGRMNGLMKAGINALEQHWINVCVRRVMLVVDSHACLAICPYMHGLQNSNTCSYIPVIVVVISRSTAGDLCSLISHCRPPESSGMVLLIRSILLQQRTRGLLGAVPRALLQRGIPFQIQRTLISVDTVVLAFLQTHSASKFNSAASFKRFESTSTSPCECSPAWKIRKFNEFHILV